MLDSLEVVVFMQLLSLLGEGEGRVVSIVIRGGEYDIGGKVERKKEIRKKRDDDTVVEKC